MVDTVNASPQDERIAPTLRGALRDEFRRIRRPPYGVLWCVGINFVLVTTFWFVPWPVVEDCAMERTGRYSVDV